MADLLTIQDSGTNVSTSDNVKFVSANGISYSLNVGAGEITTTAALASGTAGAVQFSAGSGSFSSDASNLFWDDTNNRLGVGTASPSNTVTVAGQVGIETTGDNDGLAIGAADGTVSGAQQLVIGYHKDDDCGHIQAVKQMVGYRNLILQRDGGNVGIGTIDATHTLHVDGDAFIESNLTVKGISVDAVGGALKTALDGYVTSGSFVPTSRQVIAGTGLTGGGDLTADRTFDVSYGTTSTTACRGDDSRLSASPTKVAGSVTDNFVSFSDTNGNQKDSGCKASDFALASNSVPYTGATQDLNLGSKGIIVDGVGGALKTALDGYGSTSGVPYTGATNNVNLGNKYITADDGYFTSRVRVGNPGVDYMGVGSVNVSDGFYVNGTLVASTATLTPTGTVVMFAGTSIPAGWLVCDGSAVSRSTYSALYGAITTTWGVGDGSTTFNLPNFVSKFPMGALVGGGMLGYSGGSLTISASSPSTSGPSVSVTGAGSSHTHLVNSHSHNMTNNQAYAQMSPYGGSNVLCNRISTPSWTGVAHINSGTSSDGNSASYGVPVYGNTENTSPYTLSESSHTHSLSSHTHTVASHSHTMTNNPYACIYFIIKY